MPKDRTWVKDWTVLSMAVLKERSPELIAALVRKGANANARNSLGYTPLHTAVTTRNPKVVAVLLKEGKADPNIPNNAGMYPLQTALCISIASQSNKSKNLSFSLSPFPFLSFYYMFGNDRLPIPSEDKKKADRSFSLLAENGADLDISYPSGHGLLKTALFGNSASIIWCITNASERAGSDLKSLLKVPQGSSIIHSLIATKASTKGGVTMLKCLLENLIRDKQLDVDELDEAGREILTIIFFLRFLK